MTPLRLVFAGTPDFAVPSLQALIDFGLGTGWSIAAVYTQPDRPAGRGRRLAPSPVKALALEHGLPVLQPESFKRDPDAVEALRALGADLTVVAAYGLILPPSVLAAPRLGCINVHASLLPRWRGAAPIQRAILAGDTETGVCIMGMEAGLDTGPVYLRRSVPIRPDDTGGSLTDTLAALGARALVEALPGIAAGTLVPEPQDPAGAVYAHKIDKAEAEIDWSAPAAEIARKVRAFDPWPVAQTRLGGEVLRIWAARAGGEPTAAPAPPGSSPASASGAAAPGSVLTAGHAGIVVATGDGALTITRLQPPGKRPMEAAAFLAARRLEGARLG